MAIRKNKIQHGFTLLETIVVLAIAGLIFTVIPPMLPNVMDNTYAKSATRKLVANLKHIRSKAISKQQETTLLLDVEKKQFQVGEKNQKLKLSNDTSLSLITAKSEQISEHQGQIRFFPDGSSTGGQIKLTNSANEILIDINWLTGKVKILP